MLQHRLALVSEVSTVHHRTLTRIAAALNKQVTQDFAPIWGILATVDAFVSLDDVPVGYWPIIVETDINTPGAAGIHEDQTGQPFALIEYSNAWSLTASHEALEMLGDPWGRRVHSGQSVKPDQGRVEFLVEVCDPCETAAYGYHVNGILVSDFYTPRYFDPVGSPHVQYSFTGAISQPRSILPGGYLSWHEPIGDHWWQAFNQGGQLSYRDLGVLGKQHENLRHATDRQTPFPDLAPELLSGLADDDKHLVAMQAVTSTIDESASSKAAAWREQIAALKGRRA
jgi:hypothetical protein